MAKPLSYEKFNAVLRYDANTGVMYWNERTPRNGKQLGHLDRTWNALYASQPTGRLQRHGHLYINHKAKNYAVHRLAWLLHYKTQPPDGIDHINGDPADNRILNLRPATQSENLANAAIRSDNTSGVRGVSWSKSSNAWYVYINKNKKMYPLGMTKSFEEACAIRKSAEEKFFGEYARAS